MSVYTQLDDDEVARQVAARLREQRKHQQLTLKDLATRLDVSIATLSAIENHQVSPDVDLLLRLAEALAVTVDSLLPRYGHAHFQITRRTTIESTPPAAMKLVSRTRRSATPYHNRLWLLADSFAGRHLEPFEIEIQPVAEDDLHFISHHHEEFVFVLRGSLEIIIKGPDGLVRETLNPGDCACFWSYLPHCIRSTTDQPARSVHVQCSLDEAADSGASDSVSGPVIYLREAPHKNAIEQLATKLIHLRQAHGMSAAEFARHLGLSTRRLMNIEQGRRPMPLKLLLQICHTFRKPPHYFLAGTVVERPLFAVSRAADIRLAAERGTRPPADLGCFDGTFTSLTPGFGNVGMEPYLVRLRAGETRERPLVTHAGQEFVYVLHGTVKLTTTRPGETTNEVLAPGDSCLIDAAVPHGFSQASFTPYDTAGAELLAVFWRPLTR